MVAEDSRHGPRVSRLGGGLACETSQLKESLPAMTPSDHRIKRSNMLI